MDCQCQETEALLRDYVAGRLTQSDRQRVELIIEDWDQCAKTLTQLQLGQRFGALIPIFNDQLYALAVRLG